MKTQKLLILMLILFPLTVFCQFSAKMSKVRKGEKQIYTVYSDLHQYRYEFVEGGSKGIVIVKPETNNTLILIPDKKFVHKTTCDDFSSIMNDPVQSFNWQKKQYTVKNMGDVTLNGYDCILTEIYQDTTKISSEWFSKKLNFPVKIVNDLVKDTYVELNDITKWKPDKSYFSVPEGYTEVDERMRPVVPEPPPPDKWETVTVTLPYEGTVKRGTKLKFKITGNKNTKLFYADETDKPAKFIRHSFKDGKEKSDSKQGPLNYRTSRLYPKDKSTMTYAWNDGDEIVIEVYEGEIHFKIYSE